MKTISQPKSLHMFIAVFTLAVATAGSAHAGEGVAELSRKPLAQSAMDVAVEMTKIAQLIENKEREIRFNSVELMSLEIEGLPGHERESERERLALANEVLSSEIEDLAARKAALSRIASKSGATERALASDVRPATEF